MILENSGLWSKVKQRDCEAEIILPWNWKGCLMISYYVHWFTCTVYIHLFKYVVAVALVLVWKLISKCIKHS